MKFFFKKKKKKKKKKERREKKNKTKQILQSRYSYGAKNMYCNVTRSHRSHMVEA